MLTGIDISHHNSNMKNPAEMNALDFVIMKATEGVRYKDPWMQRYMQILDPSMLYGFYHFARPDLNNAAENEAYFFINTIRKYISNRSILALDVEADALNVPDVDLWCAIWAQVVEVETGIRPMIYLSASQTKKFQITASLGCGLWVAKWGIKKPTKKQLEPWDFYAIWQYSNQGIISGVRTDLDQFNGTKEQWMKYCKRND